MENQYAFNVGDIWIANSKLFTSVIVDTNDIGVFVREYHFGGDPKPKVDFVSYVCFTNNYSLVTPDEFDQIIEQWRNEQNERFEKFSNGLTAYKQNVMNDVGSKR